MYDVDFLRSIVGPDEPDDLVVGRVCAALGACPIASQISESAATSAARYHYHVVAFRRAQRSSWATSPTIARRRFFPGSSATSITFMASTIDRTNPTVRLALPLSAVRSRPLENIGGKPMGQNDPKPSAKN